MRHQSTEVAGSRVRIHYTLDLDYDLGSPSDFIFLIHAARTAQQRVVDETLRVDPAVEWRVDIEPHFGNRLLRLAAPPGPLHVSYAAAVEVDHYVAEPAHVVSTPLDRLPTDTVPFLWSSRYCQADQVQQLAYREFSHMPSGYAQVDAICRWVRSQLEFRVGTSTVRTSALETLEQRMGVCRDFAHSMIAILRGLNYPARFVTGVDYGASEELGPPDFHSYVEAYIGDRWWLFDPTGIAPLTGLIRIGTGRDAADVAFATMFGNVQGRMPRVAFTAEDDPAAGIRKPEPTSLAISTAR
ncbi:MAG TPA: transglutaminase family protein [Casimicrobiaceae bacterium]|nr:transglutaminase family protein [Casimicrobiaceae bacterium]